MNHDDRDAHLFETRLVEARAEAEQSSLGHVPKERWEFDESVERCFGDMLSRSVPGYPQMRQTVHQVAREFARPGGTIIDLGSSKGDAIATMLRDRGMETSRFVAVENAPAMLAALRRRFELEPRVSVLDHDIRNEYRTGDGCEFQPRNVSIVLSILTLQFVEPEARARILRRVYRSLVPGGALILVEKVLAEHDALDRLLVKMHHSYKAGRGYTEEEIARKRLALRGVMQPTTALSNELCLILAGFPAVECFWRDLNFAAWVAVKEPNACRT